MAIPDSIRKNKSKNDVVQDYIEQMKCDLFLYSGGIMYMEAARFVDLVCANKSGHQSALLFLSTPGGDPHAAYRMIKALRMKYKTVSLGVLGPCKSAGTLIAVGAHKLLMAETGELGPLDVQLTKPDELVANTSGLDIFQALAVTTQQAFAAFEQYMFDLIEHSTGAISTKTAAEVARDLAVGLFAPITGQVDPNRLGELQRAIRIANAYAENLGAPNMRPKGIERLVEGYPSHGFVIDIDEAKKIFTSVELLGDRERAVAAIFRPILRHVSREARLLDIGASFQRQEPEKPHGIPTRSGSRKEIIPPRHGDGSQGVGRRQGSVGAAAPSSAGRVARGASTRNRSTRPNAGAANRRDRHPA